MGDTVHIIGAGLIGLSTADSLLDRGERVVLWDRAPAPGMGASFSNGAILHPSQSAPWVVEGLTDDLDENTREALAANGLELARRSGERLTRRMRELGMPERRRGAVQIFNTEEARDTRLRSYARMGTLAEPFLWFDHSAISIPGDSSADARAYTLAMAEDLARRGAEIRTGSEVSLCEKHGKLEVACGAERVPAERIVVAAGGATAKIIERLGLDLPVMGVPGHALSFLRSDDFADPGHAVMHADSRTALTILGEEVRISGSVGLGSPEDLLPIWREIVPDLIEELGEPRRAWTGYRPCTPDGKPVMGPTPIKGLFVNTGHAHMGWTLCAGAGELVADDVVGAGQRESVLEAE